MHRLGAIVQRVYAELLPAFLHRYRRGNGRELLWRLVDAVERRDLSAALGMPVPGQADRERAQRMLEQCPVTVDDHAEDVLGVALRQLGVDCTVAPFQFVSDELMGVRCIVVRPTQVALATDDELVFSLLHEVIRSIESHLVSSERMLAATAGLVGSGRPSLERCVREDRRAVLTYGLAWAAGVAVVVATVGVVVLSSCS